MMLTIFLFTLAVSHFAVAQNKIDAQVIQGVVAGSCPLQSLRDAAHQNLSQSVRSILLHNQNTSSTHPCGTGQWTRVAYLNMSDPSQQCPSSWRLYSANGVRACGRQVTSNGRCYSQFYTVQQSYRKVCGRIIGYQVGSTDVFGDRQLLIDQTYVDGVSLTYGSPRQHIWTFASGLSETITTSHSNHERYTCPCALVGTGFRMQQPPSYVGNNYFCESGNPATTFENTNTLRYTNDPLWDGQRCEGQCCNTGNDNSPPWFNAELPSTTNENMEVRICGDNGTSNEDSPIGLIELYVQ